MKKLILIGSMFLLANVAVAENLRGVAVDDSDPYFKNLLSTSSIMQNSKIERSEFSALETTKEEIINRGSAVNDGDDYLETL